MTKRSISRLMVKEILLHIHMKYYSVISSHAFESVLMRRKTMKPITQSEETKKEKDKGVY